MELGKFQNRSPRLSQRKFCNSVTPHRKTLKKTNLSPHSFLDFSVRPGHPILAKQHQHLPRRLYPKPSLLVRHHRSRFPHRRAQHRRDQRQRPTLVVVLCYPHARRWRRSSNRVHVVERHTWDGEEFQDSESTVLVQHRGPE